MYGVEYDYVFGSVKGGGLPVTTENGKMYGSIPSKYYANDEARIMNNDNLKIFIFFEEIFSE